MLRGLEWLGLMVIITINVTWIRVVGANGNVVTVLRARPELLLLISPVVVCSVNWSRVIDTVDDNYYCL